MSSPAFAIETQNGRYYRHPGTGEELVSVTNILGDALRKYAIEKWGPKTCAEYVVDNMPLIRQTLRSTGGRAAAIDLIKGSPYRSSDDAKDIGSLFHKVAEAIANEWTIPEYDAKLEPFVRAFRMWLDEWQPQFLHTELTVWNRKYGYAGSLDAIALIDGTRWLIDYKTSKFGKQGHGIYPEVALQLVAYRQGEFIITRNGTELPMPEVDRCAGLNIREDNYRFVPVETDDKVFRTFLYAIQMSKFQKQGAQLIGHPLAPPIREDVVA